MIGSHLGDSQTFLDTRHDHITQGSTMTKRRKTTDTRGPLQRLHDREEKKDSLEKESPFLD